jgi:hypothetical protein
MNADPCHDPISPGFPAGNRNDGRGPTVNGHGLGAVLVAMALTACVQDATTTGVRPASAATSAMSCDASATAALAVHTIDSHGTPVAGATVTLSVEGVGNGVSATSDRRGAARFAAVAACSSVGIWVSREGADVGFAQVVLPPGGSHSQRVTVRR